ncbi:MAG: ribulose-phosphate 3-epimerase [Firmicutes bacterium]|nr:ribulose-phosphate 3-epimerase [Bacillota bacterium]
MARKLRIAASTLAPAEQDLLEYVSHFEAWGVDLVHCDIIDGKFAAAPKTYDYKLLGEIKTKTKFPLDVHLMVNRPSTEEVLNYISAGAGKITLHYEAYENKVELMKNLRQIRYEGKKAGISIKPETELNNILEFLPYADIVLVMSVTPGKCGQSFLESSLDSVRELVKIREDNNLKYDISVDGGVNETNAKAIKEAGADIVVLGSALFKAADKKALANVIRFA